MTAGRSALRIGHLRWLMLTWLNSLTRYSTPMYSGKMPDSAAMRKKTSHAFDAFFVENVVDVRGEVGADGLFGEGKLRDHSATRASMFARPWMRERMKSSAIDSRPKG